MAEAREQELHAFWFRRWPYDQLPEIMSPLMTALSEALAEGDPAEFARARRRVEDALEGLDRSEP